MLYIRKKMQSRHIKGNEPFEGVSLERELKGIFTQGIQPDRNITQVFYTNKKDGVLPSTDIRTDRFDIGLNAMEKVNKAFHDKINEQKQMQLEKFKQELAQQTQQQEKAE